jgi:hypothetical protein
LFLGGAAVGLEEIISNFVPDVVEFTCLGCGSKTIFGGFIAVFPHS